MPQRDSNWGWNMSSDPCIDEWVGVSCDSRNVSVRKIVFDEYNFTGILDASLLCKADSLVVLSLEDNNIGGEFPKEIVNCKQLTHLYLKGNQFSGKLPDSLSGLSNLKRLIISDNNFSGELPDIQRISGLLSFLAQNNKLSGQIPDFDFSNLEEFDVSNNNFSGPIPDVKGFFSAESFRGNPELCGKPLSEVCPPAPPSKKESKSSSSKQFLIYLGYILLGLVVVLLIAYKLVSKNKSKKETLNVVRKKVALEISINKPSSTSSDFRTGGNKSEYSVTSVESGMATPLMVLSSPVVKGLRFEDLLRSPAEMLGRGKYGSLYKVMLADGVVLAVKRIKDWDISKEEFKERMHRIDQVKHPNVLAPVAFYCSKQEKLLVYEYQNNGSLFKLLHGSQQVFDWGSRLNVASTTAAALAFMHEKLYTDKIAHGNLKSTNIMFNNTMDGCISEYGLLVAQNQNFSETHFFNHGEPIGAETNSSFKVDTYCFGVILLELLTGKMVQTNGFDLAKWVYSVVKEEWTAEVFDRALMEEGANEERMVNLLQVALRCINPNPMERPTMREVAVIINTIKEEEDRSTSSET